MGRVEIEDALFVRGSRRDRVIVPIWPARAATPEVIDGLLDRIEAVDDQSIAELLDALTDERRLTPYGD